MRALYLFPLVIFFVSIQLIAQDKPAYALFDSSGKPTTYQAMLDTLNARKDVILFGEMHDNPIDQT